jgi:hypothetical protein
MVGFWTHLVLSPIGGCNAQTLTLLSVNQHKDAKEYLTASLC